jgi:hypothetical protein
MGLTHMLIYCIDFFLNVTHYIDKLGPMTMFLFFPRLSRVLKWGLVFDERKGLTTTGHSLSIGETRTAVHSLTGPLLHTHTHTHTYAHTLVHSAPEPVVTDSVVLVLIYGKMYGT